MKNRISFVFISLKDYFKINPQGVFCFAISALVPELFAVAKHANAYDFIYPRYQQDFSLKIT